MEKSNGSSNDVDEFKRLLETLPLQPVVGRQYQIAYWYQMPAQVRWIAFTVVGFFGRGRRHTVVMRRVYDDDNDLREMTVFQWHRNVKKGSIRERVWPARRFQTVAAESTLAAHSGV